MKAASILLVIFGLMIVPVANAATHTLQFHFSGNCPPDQKVHLQCFDLTGEIAISADMQICETKKFNVDTKYQNLVCIVTCKGKEVYRQRFDLPGATWKAVPGYPHDIVRADGDPPGTTITSSTDVVIRNPEDCGNGEDDPGEACDTKGNRGCDDPLKPVCYDCAYCGCGEDKHCVQVTGPIPCGAYGCAAYERPSFGTKCVGGVCVNPRKCTLDLNCLEKYQEEKEKEVETNKTPLQVGEKAYTDPLYNGILHEERFGGQLMGVAVDEIGGMLADVLGEGESETYTIDGAKYDVTVIDIEVSEEGSYDKGKVKFEVNEGAMVGEGMGGRFDIDGGVELVIRTILPPTATEAASVDFYINSITGEELLDALYTDQNKIFPIEAHRECKNYKCAIINGKGEDQCTNDFQCGATHYEPGMQVPGYHWACVGTACHLVEGEGNDTCKTDMNCIIPGPTHYEEPPSERYKNIMADAPPIARELLGDEKINFYVDGETAYAILEDGVVVEAGEGEYEDNTVNVYTDMKTVEDLESGETTFVEAMDEGRIIIEGEGFFNGIRFWLIKLFYGIGRMLD